MSKENQGAEILENLSKTAEAAAKALENSTQVMAEVKSLTQSATEALVKSTEAVEAGFKAMAETKETEEKKSLEIQVKNLEAQVQSYKAGQGSYAEAEDLELEEKSLVALAKAVHNKGTISLEEEKSIRFSDSTSVGFRNRERYAGDIDINKQVSPTILQYVDILPPSSSGDESVVYSGYDESLLDMKDVNEMDAAALTKELQHSEIKIQLKEKKASQLLSSKVIMHAMAGDKVALAAVKRNEDSLDKKYQRILAAQVYQDIIAFANDGKIGKKDTTTAEAPATAGTREDLRLFPSLLKADYVPTSVLFVSRAFINALYSKEAADGHLVVEQFETGVDGIRRYVTPEYSIPVQIFEHAQIGNYKSLADGSTAITTDYVPGGTNAGKLLAFVADLKYSYKLIPCTIGFKGFDANAATVVAGSAPMVKSSYAGQGIVAREAIKVLFAKA